MNNCHVCNYPIKDCLNLTDGHKCCPDCVCHIFDQAMEEYANQEITDE